MTILDLPPHLPMTAEELEELPSVEGWRIELWEGNLDVASARRPRRRRGQHPPFDAAAYLCAHPDDVVVCIGTRDRTLTGVAG